MHYQEEDKEARLKRIEVNYHRYYPNNRQFDKAADLFLQRYVLSRTRVKKSEGFLQTH